jgi:guanosine-3',5'-bis(diphosphate) 3'-pyrophosphohydrolase
MTTVKEILGAMQTYTPEDEALIQKAYAFAEKAHADQKRYSGEPYFIHPSAVAKHLATLGMDTQTVAAGLLHDTMEDAGVSEEEIEKEFGQ